jgi:site-specific recombinase XerD
LQDHVCDIRTLQLWLGHNDLASTMVYLKAVRNKDVAARVSASELAAFAGVTQDVAHAHVNG